MELASEGSIPSTVYPGIGQEAAMVGLVSALEDGDLFAGTHRDLMAALAAGVTVEQAALNFLGKAAAPSRGRDGGGLFGLPHKGIAMVTSSPAGSLPLAVGAALAFAQRSEPRVALADCGEGSMAAGIWHEAVNLASVLMLPVVFTVQNNQFSRTTPNGGGFNLPYAAHRADGYGIPGVVVDGNDVLDCYAAAREAVDRARSGGGPTLIEAITFRHKGHDHSDPAEYVPDDVRMEWASRDPIERFEEYLGSRGYLDENRRAAVAARVDERVARSLEWASEQPDPEPSHVASDVFAVRFADVPPPPPPGGIEMDMAGAVRAGIDGEMARDERVYVMGRDLGVGGPFGIAAGLADSYGPMRVVSTPVADAAVIGAAARSAAAGMSPIVVLESGDDVYRGIDQLVSIAGVHHWKTGTALPMVVVAPTGAGSGLGPASSRSLESVIAHHPGIKVAVPATPQAARGLLAAAVHEPNPVVILAHRLLLAGPPVAMPSGPYEMPLGRARIARAGADVTVVAWGAMVDVCLSAAEHLAGEGVEAEVIDLQSIMPLDWDTLFTSVRATSRLVIVDEGVPFGGVGAEIAAGVASELIWDLDGPVLLVSPPQTHVPFARDLEIAFLPGVEDVLEAVHTLAIA
ncbi:hypothetical protein HQ535_07530 [bacterium]|nr:hypothetical protein [bacterium]